MEWYDNGFPHWHLFIETEEAGKAGRIGHEVIKRYWPHGIYIWESYIKSEEHWKELTGYFDKGGYFEKGKGNQGKLPAWASDGNRKIKRWHAKPGGGSGKKRPSRMRLNESSPGGEGFSIDVSKCEKCNFQPVCETEGDGNGCLDYGEQANSLTNSSEIHDAIDKIKVRKTYRVKIAECGASCLLTIDGGTGEEIIEDDYYLKKIRLPFSIVKALSPCRWEYLPKKGLTCSMSREEKNHFLSNIEFLESGKLLSINGEQVSAGSGVQSVFSRWVSVPVVPPAYSPL